MIKGTYLTKTKFIQVVVVGVVHLNSCSNQRYFSILSVRFYYVITSKGRRRGIIKVERF